jgi:GT2 family glycosyltransferase
MNYDGRSDAAIESGVRHGINIVNIARNDKGVLGFAEAHNILFNRAVSGDCFVIVNPDCIAQPGAVDALVERYRASPGAYIVEGRQWPFEHPKEFDPLTFETPWASGAFQLIDSLFYRSVGGMEERYFLYMEDVDLSWQAWLRGGRVLYEPAAAIMHFSGGNYYREDIVSNELYYSIRNFVLLCRKFFGRHGDERARKMMKAHPDRDLVALAFDDLDQNFRDFEPADYATRSHPRVKVTGLCQFHEMR